MSNTHKHTLTITFFHLQFPRFSYKDDNHTLSPRPMEDVGYVFKVETKKGINSLYLITQRLDFNEIV